MTKKKNLTTIDIGWHVMELSQMSHEDKLAEWSVKLYEDDDKINAIDEVADEMQEFIKMLSNLIHHLGGCRESIRAAKYSKKGKKK